MNADYETFPRQAIDITAHPELKLVPDRTVRAYGPNCTGSIGRKP